MPALPNQQKRNLTVKLPVAASKIKRQSPSTAHIPIDSGLYDNLKEDRKMKLIPTIFAHNKKEFEERFKKILPISKNIQIDFMDGKFVKAKSIQPRDIPNLAKFKNNFEAHLMCLHPEKYLSTLKQKGFKKIFFHFEATKNPEKILNQIKSLNLTAGIAFNPNAPIKKIIELSNLADVLLFMGHTPGVEGVSFNPKTLEKIKALRKTNKKIKIQVDGGASPRIIPKLAKAGVNYANIGSYVSKSKNPKQAFKKLNRLCKS